MNTPLAKIQFPAFSGIRCLMMPYIQGDPESVPKEFRTGYEDIIANTHLQPGEVGFLTIDESTAKAGMPHRGTRAKAMRALHTEAGLIPGEVLAWGHDWTWGGRANVTLDRWTEILLANNLDDSCAVWDGHHPNTSRDGDIGHEAHLYPYDTATFMKAGDVHKIGILQPHESVRVKSDTDRQFLRIIGQGVRGREAHFTVNPLVPLPA